MSVQASAAVFFEQDFLRSVDFTCSYEAIFRDMLELAAALNGTAVDIFLTISWSDRSCTFSRLAVGTFEYREALVSAREGVSVAGIESPEIAEIVTSLSLWVVAEKKRRDDARAEERRRNLSAIVGLLIHNVKNPISGISGFAQLIAAKSTETFVQEYCRIIFESIDLLERVNNDLVNFVHGDLPVLEMDVMDAGSFFDGIVRKNTETFRHAGITVNGPAAPSCRISANKDRLTRSLTAIFCNARESMLQGGTIDVAYAIIGAELRVAISDSGSGMPIFVSERACELLYSWNKPGAVGLGLAQARNILEAHGGALALDSLPGRGTTIVLTIPIVI